MLILCKAGNSVYKDRIVWPPKSQKLRQLNYGYRFLNIFINIGLLKNRLRTESTTTRRR